MRFEKSDPDVTLSLEAKDALFRDLPSDRRQRVLDSTTEEFLDELRHLCHVARGFRPGRTRPPIQADLRYETPRYDRGTLYLGDQEVMQEWERPIMAAMADYAAGPSRSVLEIGFGLGICASLIQERGVAAHTIVESNPHLCDEAKRWRTNYSGKDITIVSGRWQEVMPELGLFDAVVLDPFAEREEEMTAMAEGTYQAQSFDAAAAHLRTGGVFVYYASEIDSLGRAHQRGLLKRFSEIRTSVVRGLQPPPDCAYWVADSMAVVAAVK